MARSKVKIAYMTSDSARRTTYNKRKNSLLKKMNELSTLCDVEVCGVIYNPTEVEPAVYPSPNKVQRVLDRLTTMDKPDQGKNMLDMEGFLRQSIERARERLDRLRRENWEKEMTRVMFEAMNSPGIIEGMGMVELKNLSEVINRYSVAVHMRMIKLAKIRATAQVERP